MSWELVLQPVEGPPPKVVPTPQEEERVRAYVAAAPSPAAAAAREASCKANAAATDASDREVIDLLTTISALCAQVSDQENEHALLGQPEGEFAFYEGVENASKEELQQYHSRLSAYSDSLSELRREREARERVEAEAVWWVVQDQPSNHIMIQRVNEDMRWDRQEDEASQRLAYEREWVEQKIREAAKRRRLKQAQEIEQVEKRARQREAELRQMTQWIRDQEKQRLEEREQKRAMALKMRGKRLTAKDRVEHMKVRKRRLIEERALAEERNKRATLRDEAKQRILEEARQRMRQQPEAAAE